jgi:tetratricopeptide (TPR) repeat protein
VRAAVVERAEGNPLYVEEFVRLLIETGQIAHRGGERRVGTSDQLVVPPTLKGLIAARIDTAPPPVKKLLQRAAVIGRQFPTSGLAALSDGAPPEIAHLRDAVRRDLLIDVDERGVGGGRVYRFKHVLIQDVAYASLPKGERALLHERYMRWFEDALGDRREDFIPLLAHHAEQAYALAAEMGLPQASELARRAFDRLMEAADRAKAANDVAAELGLFRRVAAIAPDAALSVEERLSLDGWLALARHQVEMSRESLDEVDRVMSRARDAGATTLLVELLDSRIDSAVTPSVNPRGERDPVREEMRALALASGDPKLIIRAMLRRITPFTSVTEDVAFLTEAVAFAAAHGLEAWRRGSLLLLSDKYRDLLRFSEADRIMSELERSAASQQSASDLDTVRFQRALLSLQRDELTAAVSEFEETIALARGMGHIRRELRATHWKARTLVFLGRWDDAIEQLNDLLQQIEGKVLPSTHWVARLWLAYALVKVGRTQEARATFEAGQAFAVANPTFHAWANWVHGVLRAAERRPEEAAGLFAKGAGQFGDSVIPHFIFDRAEVLIQSGRAPEARGLLSDLRARLNDPLADRLRVRTDDLLARAATTTVQA